MISLPATVLRSAGVAASPPSGPPSALVALLERARAAEVSGDWSSAIATYAAAFRLLTTEGDAAAAAEIMRAAGVVHWQRGDCELAEEHFEASLAIADCAGLDAVRPRILNGMAILEQFRGGIDRARALYGAARDAAARQGDDRLLAKVDQNLGTLANIEGDSASALTSYTSALAGFAEEAAVNAMCFRQPAA